MAKAYDRVEWVFLKLVLEEMGFPGGWVYLIMKCVPTISFSVLLNGSLCDSFNLGDGGV